MSHEGGCQCGAVRYAVEAERLLGYLCHCGQCRRQSSSAFAVEPQQVFDRHPDDLSAWRAKLMERMLEK